jgi:hypothetical protein
MIENKTETNGRGGRWSDSIDSSDAKESLLADSKGLDTSSCEDSTADVFGGEEDTIGVGGSAKKPPDTSIGSPRRSYLSMDLSSYSLGPQR